MKLLLVLCLVAIATAINSNEEEGPGPVVYNYYEKEFSMEESETPLARSSDSLQWGDVGPDDRLIASTRHLARDLEYQVNDNELAYQGSKDTTITCFRVYAYSNFTETVLVNGGLGKNYVTLGFKGLRSQSIDILVDIYATVTCANM